MSQLLDAARRALPGCEWTEIGPEARSFIGKQLVYLTDRGSDGVFAYAGPDAHRWLATADEAAAWLRAQVEARRDTLNAALGDSQWSRVAELVGMRSIAAARADAAEAKLKALAWLVAEWPTCPHAEPHCATVTRGGDCTCGAVEADLARAEARRLLGVENG